MTDTYYSYITYVGLARSLSSLPTLTPTEAMMPEARTLKLYRVTVLVPDPRGNGSYTHRRVMELYATSPREAEEQVRRRVPLGRIEGRTRQ